ncbi:MAG: hypothetical protein HDS43_02365 [Bacteroides sp.]|nr:hypothetical protein [Bacteroides sp.]
MLIHNITFLLEPSRTEEFLRWFHADAISFLRAGDVSDISLAILREVQGEINPPDRGVSVACRSLFHDEEAFRAWEKESLEVCLDAYRNRFGPEALAFCTLLESLDFLIDTPEDK